MRSFSSSIFLIILFTLAACADKENVQEIKPKVETPKIDLHSAVVAGNLDVIRRHIKAETDIDVLEPSRSSTPLITSAVMGNEEAAKLLIEAGAAVNYQNTDGSTALHTALVFGKNNVANLLIASGADINIQNNDGASPLHTAAFFGRVEMVDTLLKKGADKTLKNKMGRTARETVQGPFEAVQPVYDAMGAALRPMGLTLDYEQLKTARPKIADMLK